MRSLYQVEVESSFMKELLLVAIGGALGAVARWMLGSAILHHTVYWKFPLGTFIVNVAGCLAAGVIAGLIIKQDMFSPAARLFLLTGLLGGFTTFSAFGVECMYLMRRGELTVMGLYVLLSVAAGIGGLMLAVRLIPGQPHQP
jgi:CrcB protein